MSSMQPEVTLEAILDKQNLKAAFKSVVANKGAPGINGTTTEELRQWFHANLPCKPASNKYICSAGMTLELSLTTGQKMNHKVQ